MVTRVAEEALFSKSGFADAVGERASRKVDKHSTPFAVEQIPGMVGPAAGDAIGKILSNAAVLEFRQ